MRIGEVAEQTGLSISNIRFYEKKGLIEPNREQESRYRDYSYDDVTRLRQIILYRKVDLPIETISLLVHNETSIENVMEQQLLDLREKQKMLQGSIDLCQKIVEDQSYEDIDVNYYLDYVKEEEAHGVRFAQIDDVLADFASFTQFNRIVGDPSIPYVWGKPWMNRLVLVLWCIMWIAIPVIGIIDEFLDPAGVSFKMLLFWIVWMLFFGLTFLQFRKKKNDEMTL